MQLDEVGTLRALRASRAIVDRLITEHRGRIFTTAGDSVLADFASASASRRLRWGLGAVAAVILIALAVAGWWRWTGSPSIGPNDLQQAGGPAMPAAQADSAAARNVPAQRLSIVVLPFTNLSND